MFIVRLMGFLDVLAAILMVLLSFTSGLGRVSLLLAAYLIIKGYMNRNEMLSILDLVAGVYLLVAIAKPITFLTILFAAYLFVKGMYCLAA